MIIELKNVIKIFWCNVENIAIILLKHLKMNQISALNNSRGVDMPLNK